MPEYTSLSHHHHRHHPRCVWVSCVSERCCVKCHLVWSGLAITLSELNCVLPHSVSWLIWTKSVLRMCFELLTTERQCVLSYTFGEVYCYIYWYRVVYGRISYFVSQDVARNTNLATPRQCFWWFLFLLFSLSLGQTWKVLQKPI